MVMNLDHEREMLIVRFGLTGAQNGNTVANGAHVNGATVANGSGAHVDDEVTSSGKSGAFPFCWLRQNCQCSECCHQLTKNRTFLMRNLNADDHPISCQVDL